MFQRPMLPSTHKKGTDDVEQQSPSDTIEDADLCGGGSSDSQSLEDTLSLTCDEDNSLASSGSDNGNSITIDDNMIDVDLSIYRSPDLLRKRLMPLAPSPILDSSFHSYHDHATFDRHLLTYTTLWRKRSAIRLLCFSLTILSYVVYSATFQALPRSTYQPFIRGLAASTRGTRKLSPEAQEWDRFVKRKAPKILQKLSNKSTNIQYTIKLKGHRLDLVLQSLDYHAQCPSVKSVQVEWNHPTKPNIVPKSVLKHKSGKVTNTATPRTSAVFLLDEDVLLTCEEIERAFQQWRQDPAQLVGFYPFHHQAKVSSTSSSRQKKQLELRPVTLGQGAYSMLSDRAVFVHNLYLRNLPSIPEDKCQRLGLSIAISKITEKPPVAVLSKPQTTRQQTVSANASRLVNDECQEWIKTVGSPELEDQVATIVGKA